MNELDNSNFIKNKKSSDDEASFFSLHSEPFYFETDALALRDNPDYTCLLKTLVLLETQRIKACEDLEKLIVTKEKSLNEPMEFLKYLTNKEAYNSENREFEMPTRQSVYLLPEINWNKYYECVDLNSEDMVSSEKLLQKFHSLRSAKRSMEQAESQNSNTNIKRARQTTEEKIINYNKSWGVDEQRRLEELLIEFPPEENEAARWRKIATKLGSRTPLQVQSHCQKFFIKLAKAGLPVPGRMPNLKTYITKKGTRGGRKGPPGRSGIVTHGGVRGGTHTKRIVGRGVTLNEISSMLSSFNPPITMNDDNEMMDEDENDDEDYDSNQMSNFNDDYDEEEYYDNDEYDETSRNKDGHETDSTGFISERVESVVCKFEPLQFSDSEYQDNRMDSYHKNNFG